MNEIERIKAEQFLKEAKLDLDYNKNLIKVLDLRMGRLTLNDKELNELVKYFEEKEEFNICQKIIEGKIKNNE